MLICFQQAVNINFNTLQINNNTFMTQFESLLAADNLEGAFELLDKSNAKRQEVILAMSQWSSIQSQLKAGLIYVTDSDYKKSLGQLKYSMTLIAKTVTVWPAENVIVAPVLANPTNKVAAVRSVFRRVKEDIENLEFSKDKVSGYVGQLNSAMESNSFDPFLDSLNGSEWGTLNSVERNGRIQKVLENLARNEEKILSRVTEHQSKVNGTVSLEERITTFFTRPTLKSWNELADQLSERFSDASLFGRDVLTAFEEWKRKINKLDDELMFAMDFNFDFRKDFGAFLNTNLQIKNFNY
jgi:hypothetical protein